MKKSSKIAIFSLILVILSLFLLIQFFSTKGLMAQRALATVGEDDRFYVHNSKWSHLLSGSVQVITGLSACSGFLIEGDIIVTGSHCLSHNPSVLNEDGSLNVRQLKKVRVYFNDAHFIYSLIDLLDTRLISYSVKDVFLAANLNDCKKETLGSDFFKNDFAFIKLNKEIPKKYKRFKMLKDINLKNYEILDQKFQKGLSVSTVGFHGDNNKTSLQRLAHIGCKMRDIKKYKGNWFFQTDCDMASGASGSPLFKILKNKKTGEIELGVLGILIAESSSFKKPRTEEIEGHSLAISPQYHSYPYALDKNYSGQYSLALSLTNHLLFNKILQKFKKDPSQLREHKVLPLKEHNLLSIHFLAKTLESLNTKQLKGYLNFLKKEKLLRLSTCYGSSVFTNLSILKEIDFLKNKKQDILEQFIKNTNIEIKEKAKKYLNNKKKTLSYKNVMKAYDISVLKEDTSHQNAKELNNQEQEILGGFTKYLNTKVKENLQNYLKDKGSSFSFHKKIQDYYKSFPKKDSPYKDKSELKPPLENSIKDKEPF